MFLPVNVNPDLSFCQKRMDIIQSSEVFLNHPTVMQSSAALKESKGLECEQYNIKGYKSGILDVEK